MTAAAEIVFDSDEAGAAHDPALYRPTATVPTLDSLDDVDDRAVAFYHEHGYLSVARVLTPEQVAESIANINDMVTGRRVGHSQTMYELAAKRAGVENLTESQKLAMVRKLAFFGDTWQASGLPVQHEGILRVARMLMGGREPKPFQVMTLLKPAHGGREKPWHQDHAYFDLKVEDRIIGVWIALEEARIDNGCMQVLDGGHKLGPMLHWRRRDWQICDTQVMGKTSLAVPLPPGGALFFDSLLPHGTPTNHSPDSRRAMQFHYAPADGRAVATEDRLAIFGTEGKDVTC